VLTDYLRAAMRQARYEILPEDKLYYGEIPALAGVWASAATLESCREELGKTLEDWILVRVAKSLDIPPVGGMEIPRVQAV
jgi:predicted RNase H-like HicB family nuclease